LPTRASSSPANVQVFQFVGVTITNKLAANSPSAPGLSEQQVAERKLENKRLVSYSLTFAVIAGILTSTGLLGFSKEILGAMGTNPEMMASAMAYLQWRALATPAVMIMNVCQGVCLGQQNSVVPLLVFSGVGLINVVLDVWLIMGQGMGCAGAAIATAAAQWLGAAYFLRHLTNKVRVTASAATGWIGLHWFAQLFICHRVAGARRQER
jgi:Na+-driven multidrug efflux pump